MIALKPYLIRAVYEWINDNNQTPYLLINTEIPDTNVPIKYIQNGKIILSIKTTAIVNLIMNNDQITFNATFSGMDMTVVLPMNSIMSIYTKETGQGMIFDTNNDTFPPPQPIKRKQLPTKKPKLTIFK